MVEWIISDGLCDYSAALDAMEARVENIIAGKASEAVWLLEHPSLYTAGTSAKACDLLDATRFPVHKTGRGGEYTYHGPGQRVVYLMLDLNKRGRDIRAFIRQIELWIGATLSAFGLNGSSRPGRIGIWVERREKTPPANAVIREDKIAAIGIRLRKWVSLHGVSINFDPKLEHFSGIVPCGIHGRGVTSLIELGLPISMNDLDVALRDTFEEVFAPAGGVREMPSHSLLRPDSG